MSTRSEAEEPGTPEAEVRLPSQAGAKAATRADAVAMVRVLAYCDQLQSELERAREKVANLEIALESNRDIGAACGILMARHRIDRVRAMDLLRHASQARHVKLRDLASDVIDTGTLELPELPYATGRLPSRSPSRGRRKAGR